MLPPSPRYTGYKSFEYLEPGRDYKEFKLAPEIGRVPAHQFDLTQAQRRRADRLLADSIVISLHEHPTVFPEDTTETFDLIRTGRHRTGYDGLARSGLTAVFDNFMDGTSCITSQAGWKWDDTRRAADGHRLQRGERARLRSARAARRRPDRLRRARGRAHEPARHRHRRVPLRRPDLPGRDPGQPRAGADHPRGRAGGLGLAADEAGQRDPGGRRARRDHRRRGRAAHHAVGRPPPPQPRL